MTARFSLEPLSKSHDRSGFTCGNARIDAYFQTTVSQDIKRNYATCFIARELQSGRIAGFYTLSSSGVPLNEVPDDVARKLPRYPTVSAVLIGWLGRHVEFAGQSVGELLLFDAIRTVLDAPIGAHAVFADAIDEGAAKFYAAYGFTPLVGNPMRLWLPAATARDSIALG